MYEYVQTYIFKETGFLEQANNQISTNNTQFFSFSNLI